MREVQREMVAIDAPRPGLAVTRCAENREDVVLRIISRGVVLDLRHDPLELHDLPAALVALFRERRAKERERRFLPALVHFLEREPRPLLRNIVPVEPLARPEREADLLPERPWKRRQEV